MPIVRFHLTEGQTTAAREAALLRAASRFYADVLQSPVDRVRAFIQTCPPQRCATGGELVGDGAPPAPYFEFLVLEGRPLEQRQALLAGFTDLLVEHIGAERALIRGRCERVSPEEWAIGGVPAAQARKEHVTALQQGAALREPAPGGRGT